jgi:hypothetical protein
MVSEDGHVMGILCDITVDLGSAGTAEVYTVPNSWAFRNGVRRFHFARKEMLENAGIILDEMGPYARHLSFRMDNTDVLKDSCDLLGLVAPKNYESGETTVPMTLVPAGAWDYSDFASIPKSETGVGLGNSFENADRWTLHACGPSVVESTTGAGDQKFTSVGIIDAYLKAKKSPPVPSAGEVIDLENNPLLAVTSQTATAGEVAELAGQEMITGAPYELGEDFASQRVRLTQLEVQGSQTFKQTLRNVFIPAGLVQFSSGISSITVTVHGIAECREYTLWK